MVLDKRFQDIRIEKSEFVAKTEFIYVITLWRERCVVKTIQFCESSRLSRHTDRQEALSRKDV